MRTFLKIIRIIVGVLFIFSGLVKANDPLGLSYKMQEFFEVWNLSGLNDYTLLLSIVMITFEIIAGVAVILGWQMNLFSWLLLLLIIFFTFLTGYAQYSGKIRECGCFGDCIPLQANQSFMKDLLLLLLIIIIFIFRKRVWPAVKAAPAILILFFTLIFSIALQWYALDHLPPIDCLPYRIGNNIPEKMKAPPGSIPDSSVIVFTYEKNGKKVSFTAAEFPADFDDSYKFVGREDRLVRKGTSVAAIRDFSLQTQSGNDTTLALLNEPGNKLFLFLKDGYRNGEWNGALDAVLLQARQKNIKSFVVTNLEAVPDLNPSLVVLRADGTAIKTAARHNPTLFLITNGTIKEKWSAADFDKALLAISKMK